MKPLFKRDLNQMNYPRNSSQIIIKERIREKYLAEKLGFKTVKAYKKWLKKQNRISREASKNVKS